VCGAYRNLLNISFSSLDPVNRRETQEGGRRHVGRCEGRKGGRKEGRKG